MPIVGRAWEQGVLRARLLAAQAGQGSLVLVGGEAGIGKTTLVAWLADEARMQGVQVLAGCCYDLTVTPPYGPWLGAFAGVKPASNQSNGPLPLQVGADLGAITDQTQLFERLHASLASMTAKQPAMLVLEDLHWSDPTSLELLHYLARHVDALSLLLIATYRADELTPRHPLFQLLPRLARDAHTERLDLRALTNDEAQALVAGRYALAPADAPRLVTYLQSRAGGNPFYLSELLRTLEAECLLVPTADGWHVGDLTRAPVPPLVRQVIESRLTRLDDETQRLLEVAAVIGQEAPFDVWRQASGAADDPLFLVVERAAEARLVLEQPGATSIAFTHALVRETVYHGQPLSRRRRLHRQVAEVLAGRPDAPLSVVAAQFEHADDPRAVAWLVRAGERALALYAAQDAVALLTRAHDLAAHFGQDLPQAAYRARATAYAMLGEFDSARRDYEIVLERARTSGDRHAEWQALLDLGLLWAERDYERTGDYCRAALELARTIDEPALIARSLNLVGNWHVNLDEPDTALPLHQEALAIFEALGDRRGQAETLDLLGLTGYFNCDFAASTRYYERAITLLRDLDDRPRLSSCLAIIACDGGDLDCTVAALVYREPTYWLRCAEEGLAIAREIGWPAGEALALIAVSIVTSVRGELGRALREVKAGLATAERIGHREWTIAARYILGRIWMEFLDPSRAAGELEQALTLARLSGSRVWTNTVGATLASLRISVGDQQQAAAVLGTVGTLDRSRASMAQRQCWFAQAELALARGQPEHSLAIVEQLTSTGPDHAPEHAAPQLLKLRGDALARLRRFDEAARAYQMARECAVLFGFRPHLWRIDVARGELHRLEGRMTEAAAAFEAARATIEEIAATIADEALRARFRARARSCLPAEQADDRHAPTPARLSPRELEVLRLLAEGKSDREIAAALNISPRTVMRHVTGILNKLGVPSRTAAATLAIRQRLL